MYFVCLLLNVILEHISLVWRRHHRRRGWQNFDQCLTPMAFELRGNFYSATPAVTLGLGYYKRCHPKGISLSFSFTTGMKYWVLIFTPELFRIALLNSVTRMSPYCRVQNTNRITRRIEIHVTNKAQSKWELARIENSERNSNFQKSEGQVLIGA